MDVDQVVILPVLFYYHKRLLWALRYWLIVNTFYGHSKSRLKGGDFPTSGYGHHGSHYTSYGNCFIYSFAHYLVFVILTTRGPLDPLSKSNTTLVPSFRASKSFPTKAERWKKTSLPFSAVMKPKPRSRMRLFILPDFISKVGGPCH